MNEDFNYEVIVMIHNLKVEGFSKMLEIFSVFSALYNLHCFKTFRKLLKLKPNLTLILK